MGRYIVFRKSVELFDNKHPVKFSVELKSFHGPRGDKKIGTTSE